MKRLVMLIFFLAIFNVASFSQYQGEPPQYPPSPSLTESGSSKKVPRYEFPELKSILTNTITGNFDNVDVRYILNFLKKQLPINLYVSPQISPKTVSINFQNTSMYESITSLATVGDIYIVYTNNTVMLLNYSEYEKVLEENFISTKIYDIRFLDTKDIKEILKPYITPLGSIILDKDNNIVIIRDVTFNFDKIESVLKEIGISPKVVMIKVDIIQVDRDNSIDYGFDLTLDNIIKSVSSISLSGAPTLSATGLFSIKFSANVENGDSGVVSGIIKALSTYGSVKLLSSPRVVCKNGQKANILIGDKVPYIKSIIQEATTTTGLTTSQLDFIDAGIKLEVSPRITISGEISVDVKVGISSYRFIDLSPTLKAPQINTTEGEINSVVKDGVPIIIGGLEKINETYNKSGIPFLVDIPIIGDLLFGNTSKSYTKSTILLVLTPEIVDYNKSKSYSVDFNGNIITNK
jgi:type II secretory pathway component GspD/PulD (secretin)